MPAAICTSSNPPTIQKYFAVARIDGVGWMSIRGSAGGDACSLAQVFRVAA